MMHAAARAAGTVRAGSRALATLSSVKDILARPSTAAAPGDATTVKGWVRTVRGQKTAAFMQVTDGSCQGTVQVVAPPGSLDGITTGCSVEVTGALAPSPAKGQAWELAVGEGGEHGVALVGGADGGSYPLQKKGHSAEFLRSLPHLRARANSMAATLCIRNALSVAVHGALQGAGHLHLHTPIITASDCEGAGELFSLAPGEGGAGDHFFGRPAFLTVSGQLQAEAFATALGKVYTFGPTFRAEDSNTSRHLAEFWMVEPETAWATLSGAMDLAEVTVKAAIAGAREAVPDDLAFAAARMDKGLGERLASVLPEGGAVAAGTFARMTYTEAVAAVQGSGEQFGVPLTWGMALGTEHEKWLAEQFVQGPVFVTDYPAGVKPFYMLSNDDAASTPHGAGTVACMDLLVPKMAELIGGSAREHRYDVLAARMEEAGLGGEGGELAWYLDLRKYGTVPHAGWGMGFERLVQFVGGVDNIRDAIPVPRAPGLCPM